MFRGERCKGMVRLEGQGLGQSAVCRQWICYFEELVGWIAKQYLKCIIVNEIAMLLDQESYDTDIAKVKNKIVK